MPEEGDARAEGHREAEQHEEHPEALPDPRRPARRLVEIVRGAPQGGAQQATAVEREAGDQVEDGERDIRRREPHEDRRGGSELREHVPGTGGIERGCAAGELGTEDEERDPEDEARDRPDERHEELDVRRRRFALDVRGAAEEEERDPAHAHLQRLRDERVRELVSEDGPEEEDCGDERDREAHRRMPFRVPRREDRGEIPRDEEEDEDPAPIRRQIDPEDSPKPQPTTHGPPPVDVLATAPRRDLGRSRTTLRTRSALSGTP